jgi:hypothetical protein
VLRLLPFTRVEPALSLQETKKNSKKSIKTIILGIKIFQNILEQH